MTTPPPPSLRTQLAPLIRAAGVSRISRAIGIHQPSLSAWCAGNRPLPLEHIEAAALAAGYRITLEPIAPSTPDTAPPPAQS